MPGEFIQGQLVYCNTSDSRWFGEVARIGKRGLQVRRLDDDSVVTIAFSNVKAFETFLRGYRWPWKLKYIHSMFFGGKALERMPRQQLRRLHRVLHDHGVEFDASCTAANDYFRMWMNPAYVPAGSSSLQTGTGVVADTTAALLPRWLKREPLPPSSRDPLGFQAGSAQIADLILPGLTVFTSRAGYFFFLCWALRELNLVENRSEQERLEHLNRLERALVLCETLHHGQAGLEHCRHLGQRAKPRLLPATGHRRFAIPGSILKNQHGTGCYNLYRTALVSCGFWRQDEELAATGLLPYELTASGAQLADAFGKREGAKSLLRWALGGSIERELGQLQQWGESLCFLTFDRRVRDKKPFLDGFLFASGDSHEVVRAANARLSTTRALHSAKLLTKPPPTTAAKAIAADIDGEADPEELEEAARGAENVAFPMHFYRHRDSYGAGPFVSAALYELLGLSFNGIWLGLLASAREQKRIELRIWCERVFAESDTPAFWNQPLLHGPGDGLPREETLLDRLLEPSFAEGLFADFSWAACSRVVTDSTILATRVLSARANQALLDSVLGTSELGQLCRQTLLENATQPAGQSLPKWIEALVVRHREVSERKGKQPWLDFDGATVRAEDARRAALGFHSYRLPQLISLMGDIGFRPGDLRNV